MPEPPAPLAKSPPKSLPHRLAWFIGLWAAGVAVVGAVGLLIRGWLAG